ncbi:IclR family transcriptional regulator [Erwiniaceae bacterium L1_54_6]|jgi:IclR family transcriptional regulator, blcABC operon repressor|nr:IclR family transcriptional regulator [Erwiniaceae bacterium L1_54_6]
MSGDSVTKSDQTRKNIDTVPALRRAVTIMDLVAASGDGLTAAEITRHLALPKSTAHGQLNVLTELGLLVRTADGTFRLGPHLMRWADGFLSQMDIVALFREYFASDSALEGYTITLTVLDRDEVVYISCRNSDKPLGHTFRIGMRLPAPFTATGKMLLSRLNDDQLNALFNAHFPAPMTAASVQNLAELKQELATIRERHFSIDNGQIHAAMTCVGAAIYDHSGRAVAGIATSFLSSEAGAGLIDILGEKMRCAALALSRQCGYQG